MRESARDIKLEAYLPVVVVEDGEHRWADACIYDAWVLRRMLVPNRLVGVSTLRELLNWVDGSVCRVKAVYAADGRLLVHRDLPGLGLAYMTA